MAKLDFNSSSLEANVIANLTNAIKDIDEALNASNTLQSPYSFSGNAELNNMCNKINTIKSELNQIISWLNQSNYVLEGINSSIIDSFNDTKLDPISKVTPIVK